MTTKKKVIKQGTRLLTGIALAFALFASHDLNGNPKPSNEVKAPVTPQTDKIEVTEEPIVKEITALDKVLDLINAKAFVTTKTVKEVIQPEPVVETPSQKQKCGEYHNINIKHVICYHPDGSVIENIKVPDVEVKLEKPKVVVRQEELDYTKQAQTLYKRATKGNAQAIKDLAYFLYNGVNVNADKELAIDLYKQAAEMGNIQAQVDLAYLHYHGVKEVIPSNKDKGLADMQVLTPSSRVAEKFVAAWTGTKTVAIKEEEPVVEESVTYPYTETKEVVSQGRCAFTCYHPDGKVTKHEKTTAKTVTKEFKIVAECDYLGVNENNIVAIGNCSMDSLENPQYIKVDETFKINHLPEELSEYSYFTPKTDKKGPISAHSMLMQTIQPTIKNQILGL